ncbi:MAG TPA: response regulator [Candidatus Polarisedimenticolia bacterium]|jgi:two-component system chemotaxis sensor kinase CheA|nr:response regulator [Candidatus Polarisedimenticolia bacterium]
MAHDPYKYFRVEARELVETLGQGLLEMEKGPPSAGLVPRLLRMAHTLKGAARVVRLPDIAEMAHAVEDALAPLRESTQQAQPQQVNAVLKLIDSIGARVGQLTAAAGVESPVRSRTVSEEPLQTVRTDIAEMDFLLDGISAASVQLGSMRRGIQAIEQARHLADLLGEQLVSRRATDANRPGHASVSPKTRSLAEDLRMVVARLEQTLVSGVEHVEREMRQVRDTAERLRLLPASVLFASLERTARDAAQALGKRVSFEPRGGDVRLDAHVLGGIQGALIQAVRNAVAHGIEPESERTSAGKPPAGRVVLEVLRRGRRVVFQCQDDGRGIDVQAVRRVAESRGLLVDGAPPSPEAMIQILLKGGLTTSGEVTEVSGRGIGLDVVREAAARLGGDVALRTEAGRGTTLELIVPVSLSSLEALLVDCSGVAAAIPLDAVRRTVRVRAEDILQTAQGNSFLHDGKTIPFFLLSRSLAPDVRPTLQARSCSVVVVDCGTALAALGVDRVFGARTVILRPLPVLAPAAPLVAGVWLDAEGAPQILIDPEGLRSPSLPQEGAVATPEAAPRLPILVVDDSLTTRMLEQSILESAGYEVEIAVSGEEALDKARRQRYRIFIVDVEMPGMDGFAFVERTRADPVLREVPAILVTSRSAPDDLRRGREVGAGAYITKNEFDQAHLLETIRRLAG